MAGRWEGRAGMGNHFDGLRLAAALAVFVSHGVFLYRLQLPVPFPGHSLGSLAVYVFFFISGYLVQQSWERKPQWRAFALKRCMRVFPGLLVAVAFSVFILGWAVTTLPTAAYWSASGTWMNFFNNAAGLATVQTLPGVFESNPFARAVNGSLWTIRYELFMYALLALLAWSTRGRRWAYPAVALALVVLWMAARQGQWDVRWEAIGGWGAEVFRWADFCAFGVPFFLGCTFAAYALRPRGWMAGVTLLAALCAYYADAQALRQLAVWSLIACGVFYAAHVGAPERQGRGRIDISYGVYIYAFPVQQAMTQLCLRQGWPLAVCLGLSLLLVLVLAVASWFWVERPCLRYGKT